MPRLTYALILLATLSTALFADDDDATPTPGPIKIPFTIAKETTIITAPLLPDGTPDYLASLNAKYGGGATPENNALLPLLKIRGTHPRTWGFTGNADLDQFLKLAGTTRPAADDPIFQEYTAFQHDHNKTVPKAFAAQFAAAQNSPWTAAQNPDLADYLQAQALFFDLAAEAARRPHLYVPFVATTAHFSTWQPVSYAGLATFGRAWTARAMLRAGSGDLDAARADLTAVRRLARHFANAGTFPAVLLGYLYDELATNAIAGIASTGTLNEAQCDAFIKSLDLPPLPMLSIGEAAERFTTLDQFILIATKQSHPAADLFDQPNAPLDALPFFEALANPNLDWNIFLKAINDERDQEVAIFDAKSPEESTRHTEALAATLAAWSAQVKQPGYALKPAADETAAAYSLRIAHAIIQTRGSALVSQDQTRFNRTIRSAMLPTLLAAAKAKARTQHWPATLADLTPAYLPQIPADPYSPTTPISLRITNNHAAIISVGPDHLPNTPDDLFLPDPPR